MQEYDVALKLLLRGSAQLTIRELTGASVETWIDVELPKIQNLRVDLLGETAEGGLVHLELQSSNDSAMALRMAEYCLGIFRLFGRFPHQVLLYVGEPALRMESELRGPDVFFRYEAVDVRALDGEPDQVRLGIRQPEPLQRRPRFPDCSGSPPSSANAREEVNGAPTVIYQAGRHWNGCRRGSARR